MTWQQVLRSHPLASRADDALFWDEFLAQNPDILNRLLADIYRVTYGADKPPSIEALWALMETPEFTGTPFGEAVAELLERRGRSQRWLAAQAGVQHPVLGRYIRGERPIVSVHDITGSMKRIEAVAKPLRVHPSYFAEWRRLWVMTLMDSAFTAHPDLSAEVFKRFSGLARPHRNARSRGH
ncbi:hypothetical protein GCM10028801_30910 [Nocardioides maradonensis]